MVCIVFASNVPALARPASHSGTSSSYKSGFSSQKSNSAAHSRPAPPAANRQSGPGAFGQQTGSPAQPQRATSAMSRDVDQSAARANALKTLDERRAAANAPPPLPPLNDSLRQPQQARAPVYQLPPPVYAPPASGSNALMHGVLGFMLGRAMSQSHQPVAYPTTQGSQPVPQAGAATDSAGMVTGMPGLGTPAPAPQPSFGASVLRWFVWLMVLSALVWLVVYFVRKLRRLRAAPNYSFERN
ncbi:hypothetical protein SAMN05192549_103215 [Duganella sacchari]|uniref:Transmembrane protein n=1 Tax=Duganella sacchari TaxID=551987 RepID=A0A1M7MKN4_9BURK|nr:hypothetical protein [Duganella sacchari]SHM91505.1 hypothetical protein SAMN05192549_103215 [Duganella sacchari]